MPTLRQHQSSSPVLAVNGTTEQTRLRLQKPMTEWVLQAELTRRWATNGACVDGVRCMLVAWEVMLPSWRINDSSRHWNEPSLDFLLADEDFNLVVMELKRAVPGVVPAWRVLSQVTHRSLLILETATADLIESSWRDCWSGQHGRVDSASIDSMMEAHLQPIELRHSIKQHS